MGGEVGSSLVDFGCGLVVLRSGLDETVLVDVWGGVSHVIGGISVRKAHKVGALGSGFHISIEGIKILG